MRRDPRRPSIVFVVAGVICVLIGSAALVGSSAPFATIAHWAVPALLIAAGVIGVSRTLRRSP